MFGEQTPSNIIWRRNILTVWTPCLVLFDGVCLCLLKFEGDQTFDQKLKTFFVLVFDGRCFVRFDSHVSNMFDAGMRTTLAQSLSQISY